MEDNVALKTLRTARLCQSARAGRPWVVEHVGST